MSLILSITIRNIEVRKMRGSLSPTLDDAISWLRVGGLPTE